MKDEFTKSWIIENSVEVCSRYDDGILTIRSLYYQLVSLGMTNDIQHYKRVVDAMGDARRSGTVRYEQFSDLDRDTETTTDYESPDLEDTITQGKQQVRAWMNHYSRAKWEDQGVYVEVLIEKKALLGVFGPPCRSEEVGLAACKGYPSLTFLHQLAERINGYKSSNDGRIVLIYFGDHDPSGDDIPRAIQASLLKDFGVEVEIDRVALNKDQVIKWGLPPAPVKSTDSRTKNFTGVGQVELDAVKPEVLMDMCKKAIHSYFNAEIYERVVDRETEEREIYVRELKEFVANL